MVGGEWGRWQQHIAPVDADPKRTISDNLEPISKERTDPITKVTDADTAMPKMKSVIVGPATAKEPLIRVIPSLLKEKLGDHALKKIALDYLDTEEDSDELESKPELIVEIEYDSEMIAIDECMEEEAKEDIAILEEAPAIFKTRKSKKTLKVREQLDDSFLRRSKRLSIKSEGFKDTKSARKARVSTKDKEPAKAKAKHTNKKAQTTKKNKKHVEVKEESMPLAVIPPPCFAPAPHLSQNILQGIGEGFLQIQPKSV